VTANLIPAAPRWSRRASGRNLTRVALTGAAGLVFAVLVLLVRGRWLPLESVDRGLAAALNEAVAGHHPTDLLGSVLLAAGWLAAMVYFVRPNCDVAGDRHCPPADDVAKAATRVG
jgi:hypothetical protein